jgi:hypothetical protein
MGGFPPGTTRGQRIRNTSRTTRSSGARLVANHTYDNNITTNVGPTLCQRMQHSRLSTVRSDPRVETTTISNTLHAERAGLTNYGTHA